jgi:D-amino-acid dehydrogenase
MSKRILIIGGGVIGLSTAYYCAKKGHGVTVLEREAEQHEGCSYGNAGLIVPSHFVPLAAPGMVALGLKWMWNPESPFYIKPRLDRNLAGWALKFWRSANPAHVRQSAPLLRDLSLASRACFEELGSLPGQDYGLVRRGLVMLCKTEMAFEEERRLAEQARALGLAAEVLDARQTAALEPSVRMDIAGSVYFPQDCHLPPSRFMTTLKVLCGQLGVKVQWNTEATGFTQKATRLGAVQTADGEFSADEFVLCAGSWSPLVARALGLRLPLEAGKGYNLTLKEPRQLPQIPAILTEARVAVTPMDGALRFGGTMEIAGLNEVINPRRVQGIIKAVPSYYPDFTPADFQGVTPWCGLRPCSPDGLPYVGRTARFANLAIATGHAMLGLSLGPITGKLIAEILSGEQPALRIGQLSPDRYG